MIDDIPEKKDKVFFLPCPNCYVKLVATFKEINTNRTCSSCKETIFISAPPQKTPPNARIEKIIAQTELQEKSVFVSCYYCQNHQKIPAYFRGKKYIVSDVNLYWKSLLLPQQKCFLNCLIEK